MTAQEQTRRQSDFSGEILTNGDYSPEFRIEEVDNTMYICSRYISAISEFSDARPDLHHLKEVMFYSQARKRGTFFVTLRIIWHIYLRGI